LSPYPIAHIYINGSTHKRNGSKKPYAFKFSAHPDTAKKIRIRSCSPTIFVRAATGYPLVVLANGNDITWPPKHFNQTTVPKAIPRIAVGYRYYPG
jgi:hypothetical protein